MHLNRKSPSSQKKHETIYNLAYLTYIYILPSLEYSALSLPYPTLYLGRLKPPTVPDTGGSVSSVATGLRQCRTDWPSYLPRTSTPVGT